MSTKLKVTLAQLQKEFPGKIVALSKDETKIQGHANTFQALFNKLKREDIDPQDCVYIGPIKEYGTIEVI